MADAMKAQMEMLTGSGTYDDLYSEALGRSGGTLADILREFEGPIREQTAQLDTDILRKTILGADSDHKYAEVAPDHPDSGKIITGYEKPAGGGQNIRVEQVVETYNRQWGGGNLENAWVAKPKITTRLIDASNNEVIDENTVTPGGWIRASQGGDLETYTNIEEVPWINRKGSTPSKTGALKNLSASNEEAFGDILSEDQLYSISKGASVEGLLFQDDGGTAPAKPIYKKNPDGSVFVAKPGTFEPGAVPRAGTGMVDVLGDTRELREGRRLNLDEQGEKLVRNNPELEATYSNAQTDPSNPYHGMTRAQAGRKLLEDYDGDLEQIATDFGVSNITLPEYGTFDTGRQAGFDEAGNFLGLAALAEDVQRGHLSRQREADLMDVARLSDQYQSIMEDYKPGTQEALDSASKILKEREKDLTGGAITVPTGSTYGGDVDAITAAAAPTLSADTAFGGELAAAGTDPLRQRLLAEAKTGLGEGLTARELRNIQEGTRAAATARGRVRDIGSVQQEVEARLLEDRQRQAMNRAFASQVLGQEAGLQTGDLGRGMQQEGMQADITQRRDLAQFGADVDRARMEQAQAQQAGQFDVGAKLDAERIGEQLKQSGTLGYIDAATRLAALEDRNQLDPFQAVLGRGGGGSLGAGQSLFGQAGYGLQSGPQYLNPEAGLGYISNMAANEAAMWGAGQQADASRYSGGMSLLGSLAKPIIGKLPVICWVAREVYGAHNPAWLDFREWILLRAPSWFRALYIGYGERFAKFISDKPRLKARIRSWMDTKIGRA
tara:strand:+ start:1406 stop:3751 length:2346 start_codon:yes stop_codon:yes gene_type:complete